LIEIDESNLRKAPSLSVNPSVAKNSRSAKKRQ